MTIGDDGIATRDNTGTSWIGNRGYKPCKLYAERKFHDWRWLGWPLGSIIPVNIDEKWCETCRLTKRVVNGKWAEMGYRNDARVHPVDAARVEEIRKRNDKRKKFRNAGDALLVATTDDIDYLISRVSSSEPPSAYHCSCGAACTAEEYIEHLLGGHDRSEPVSLKDGGADIDARLDREWIAGAKFGWNCGIEDPRPVLGQRLASDRGEGGYARLSRAIRSRLEDIAEAKRTALTESSERRCGECHHEGCSIDGICACGCRCVFSANER